MSIDGTIYSRLSGAAGLTALAGDRLFPGVAPALVDVPFVVWRRVSVVRYPAMGSDSGLVSVRIQFDIIAGTYSSMRAVVEQLRAALQRWRDPAASPEVIDCTIETELEQTEDLADAVLHRGIVDIILHHRES